MANWMKGKFERWSLNLGDLCVYVGDKEHSQLKPGLIYQVAGKELAPDSSYSHHRYRLRVAFDFANPTGTVTDTVGCLGTHKLRKLELLDLGTLRLHMDHFIREWAREQGHERAEDRGAGEAGAAHSDDGSLGPQVPGSPQLPQAGKANE